MQKYKELYDKLIEEGEFGAYFPHLSGDWLKDKKQFIADQKETEAILNQIEVDLDDE